MRKENIDAYKIISWEITPLGFGALSLFDIKP